MRLRGRTALITGAAAELARKSRLRLRVKVRGWQSRISRPTVRLPRLLSSRSKAVRPLACPWTWRSSSVTQGVAAIIAVFGGIDILVSNAGVQIVRPIEQFSFAEGRAS
jgi:3-hydroxybutyrate dehydrogenase